MPNTGLDDFFGAMSLSVIKILIYHILCFSNVINCNVVLQHGYCRKSAWIHPAFSELTVGIIFGNAYWQSSLFQSSFVQADIGFPFYSFAKEKYVFSWHMLSLPQKLYIRKRSIFTLLHNLVLINLMYWCSYFKHGIGLSYFRKNNHCSGLGVSQRRLISIECLRCDLWHPVSQIISVGRTALGF